MPEMGIAVFTPHLNALIEQVAVLAFHDISRLRGFVKLGQPVPESYLSVEINSGSPETIST